jgi:hypothetical protein
MLKRELQVSVEKPCTEAWDYMQPVSEGRYCLHCNKQVIDFTSFSDAELVHWFSTHSGQVCGRLDERQVNRAIHMDTWTGTWHYRFTPYRWLLGISMGLGLMSRLDARYILPKAPTVWQENKNAYASPEPAAEHTARILLVTVIDSTTRKPLEGVYVEVYSDSSRTDSYITDNKGQASIMFKAGIRHERRIVIQKYTDSFHTEYNTYSLSLQDSDVEQLTIPLVSRVQRLDRISVISHSGNTHIVGRLTTTGLVTTKSGSKKTFWGKITWPVRKLWRRLFR